MLSITEKAALDSCDQAEERNQAMKYKYVHGKPLKAKYHRKFIHESIDLRFKKNFKNKKKKRYLTNSMVEW